MKEPVAYVDAVDLLDADHQAVRKMFIDCGALHESSPSTGPKSALAVLDLRGPTPLQRKRQPTGKAAAAAATAKEAA